MNHDKKIKPNEKEKSPPVVANSVVQAPAAVAKKTTSVSSTVSKEAKTAPPVTKVNAEKQLKKDKS